MSEMRLALIGMGKMGRALAALAPERGFRVVAMVERGASAAMTRESLGRAEVAIEFTTPDAAPQNIRACLSVGCPVVVGTTRWYSEMPSIRAEVEQGGGALLAAPNFSIGVAIFSRVVAESARLFASVPGFEAHLVETHHRAKKDAPSGTAAVLARAVREAGGEEVPITSVRVGSVPGTHELIFDGAFEQVLLKIKCFTPACFESSPSRRNRRCLLAVVIWSAIALCCFPFTIT